MLSMPQKNLRHVPRKELAKHTLQISSHYESFLLLDCIALNKLHEDTSEKLLFGELEK